MKTFYQWYKPGVPQQVGLSLACMACFVLYGVEQGILACVQTQPNFEAQFGNPNSAMLGIIISIYNLGSFFGCLINLYAAERLGRKMTLWTGCALVVLGVALQTCSYTTAHFMVARFITGLGTGMETSTAPMYQSEVCTAGNRGKLVSAEPLFVACGIVIAYWIGYGMSFTAGDRVDGSSVSWRLPIAIQIVFAFLAMGLLFGCPESPRWLVNRHREDEALEVLARIQGRPVTDPQVIGTRDEIVKARDIEKQAEQDGTGAWKVLLTGKDPTHGARRIVLAWGVQCMNQLGGVNLVIYYMPKILVTNVGVSLELARILGGCIVAMFVVGSFIPTFFLDKMGRRPTMIVGSLVMSLCMLIITIVLSIGTKPASLAAAAFFFLFIGAFGASMNCAPWVYVPEILPLQLRSKGTAIGVSSNWIWNFFIAMITPVLTDNIGWKTYIIFTITNLVAAVLVYLYYPETANKTLEEIDYIFMKDTPLESPADKEVPVHIEHP